ncbi:hypothetical protein PFICI_06499 [Pestalotiopsis fici W106-1]|uniref:Uncharacterized protein n=1 Tax=Pestalotiopsis fici (strain W106-1 / CGMCC3.15140) TaxID=1229662 RepID=W3X7X2_PESFW|nr:uncharacterized protein PFICI_06499 [Pestalotiopsis fici W106-1]ETS81497.1 hypothetical protein PFICI_06499 [Pestalotiopsis fici W106-1]
MKSLTFSCFLGLLQAAGTFAIEYPASLNDTTSHTNPFFLQIWSSVNPAYAFQAIGVKPLEDGNWQAAVGQDSVVVAFQLVGGYLSITSPEGLHGAADGFGALFGPNTAGGEFISRQFYFTNATDQTHDTWELLNLSDDGLYSLLSNEHGPSTFNGLNADAKKGFKVCTENNSTGYYIKYEGSADGAVSQGCDAIALRTYFGPPF